MTSSLSWLNRRRDAFVEARASFRSCPNSGEFGCSSNQVRRTTRIALVFVYVIVVVFGVNGACAIASAEGSAVGLEKEATTWVAVSLRELRTALPSEKAYHFMEATRVYGFTVAGEDEEQDCILITKREPKCPLLRLDEFAVAYRNVKQSDQRPACTINPRPEMLAKLLPISTRIAQARNLRTVESLLREFEQIARSDQDVVVFGVDAETHFANVMVDADYHLKSVSNGSDEIKGVTSLTDIVLAKVKKQITQKGAVAMPLKSYNRFWFNPGAVRYRENEDTFILTKCPVTLRTEEEAVTVQGERTGLGKADPCAKEFADAFTKNYRRIAESDERYRELDNLYRFVALADVILSEGTRRGATEVVERLLGDVRISKQRHKATLPGKYAVRKLDGSVDMRQYHIRLPSCGGVSIDIRVDARGKEPDPKGTLLLIANSIRRNRPSPRSVSWEFRSKSLFRMVETVAGTAEEQDIGKVSLRRDRVQSKY